MYIVNREMYARGSIPVAERIKTVATAITGSGTVTTVPPYVEYLIKHQQTTLINKRNNDYSAVDAIFSRNISTMLL